MKGSHATFAKRKYQKVPSQRRETWAKNGPKNLDSTAWGNA